MLSRLTVRQWTARKLDRKVTDKINSEHGAAADAGRYNKALIAKEQLAAIASATNAARDFHYARTLPWLDDGARILPAAGYVAYAEGMRRLRNQFETAVSAFVSAYPAYVQDAQQRLNGLFDPTDYPDVRDIESRFSFATRVLPMPDASDFRVDISDATAAAIRADIEASTREALEAAMRDAWDRIARVVGHMVERLRAYKPATPTGKAEGTFHASLVENVRELVDVLPSFNLTADPFLASVTDRMARELCSYDATALREDAAARTETADAAAAILADVSAYLA
jgi:hypothetical protein